MIPFYQVIKVNIPPTGKFQGDYAQVHMGRYKDEKTALEVARQFAEKNSYDIFCVVKVIYEVRAEAPRINIREV